MPDQGLGENTSAASHDDLVSWVSTGLIPQAYAIGIRLAAGIYRQRN